jgi:micrococcal nuclease
MIKFPFLLLTIIALACCTVTKVQNQRSTPLVLEPNTNLQQELEIPSCQHTATAFNCVHVVEVYDGDSIFVDIDGVHPLLGKRIGIRLAEIDAPELHSKNLCERSKALEAKLVVEKFVSNAKQIDIIDVKRDKNFRIVGKVLADGESLSEELLSLNLAYRYDGKNKPPTDWCLYGNPAL